jgi:hypothetical protein
LDERERQTPSSGILELALGLNGDLLELVGIDQ